MDWKNIDDDDDEKGAMSLNCNDTPAKKHRPLRVLVDMDGVLCDFESHMLNEYRRLFPNEPFVPMNERRTFLMTDQYRQLRPGLEEKISSIMRSQGFFEYLPPIEGAVDAVKEMMSLSGVEVSICTSPIDDPYYCAQEKYEWVKRHLGKSALRQVILTCDKTLVNGDLLIDDCPAIKGSVHPRPWQQILFSQCHNLHVVNSENGVNFSHRLDNWVDRSWYKLIDSYRKRLHES